MKNYIRKYFSNEKDKVVIKNIIAAFFIKGGALLISFFSLPAFIRFFNNQEVLGVWFTILSVLIWILSFDFGIGNGLRNKLVGALVRNDKNEVKQYISSAYAVIGGIVILVLSTGAFIFPYINWNSVFNISEILISSNTMLFVVMCVFLTIMLQFFLRLISFILYALQKSALNNFMSLITSAAMLLFVLLFPSLDTETNIKILSVVYLLCVNIPLLFATVIVFATELKECHPSFILVNKYAVIGIMQLGGIFFWNQIMYMLITGSNSILITNFIGPGSVVDYQIYYRLFSLAGMLFTLALTPMWSAITKAFEEKDSAWINKYFKLLNQLVLIVFFCEFLIIPLLQIIVNIWLGQNTIDINYFYAIIFALFGGIFVYHSVLSTFACGIGRIRLQAIFYTIGIVVKVIFVYSGTNLYNDWIIIVISDIVILAPYCLAQHIALKKQFTVL
jgi:O-antigen/teichoic acid export membrane protein